MRIITGTKRTRSAVALDDVLRHMPEGLAFSFADVKDSLRGAPYIPSDGAISQRLADEIVAGHLERGAGKGQYRVGTWVAEAQALLLGPSVDLDLVSVTLANIEREFAGLRLLLAGGR